MIDLDILPYKRIHLPFFPPNYQRTFQLLGWAESGRRTAVKHRAHL
jgi:hypothetical protein